VFCSATDDAQVNKSISVPSEEEEASLATRHSIANMQSLIRDIDRYALFQDRYLEHQKFNFEYRELVQYSQYIYSMIIFVVVMVLVLAGLYLAYMQFKIDAKSKDTSVSSIEISREGVKIRSSVIGVFILIISFAFFSLYIKDIYTIHVIEEPSVKVNRAVQSDSAAQ